MSRRKPKKNSRVWFLFFVLAAVSLISQRNAPWLARLAPALGRPICRLVHAIDSATVCEVSGASLRLTRGDQVRCFNAPASGFGAAGLFIFCWLVSTFLGGQPTGARSRAWTILAGLGLVAGATYLRFFILFGLAPYPLPQGFLRESVAFVLYGLVIGGWLIFRGRRIITIAEPAR